MQPTIVKSLLLWDFKASHVPVFQMGEAHHFENNLWLHQCFHSGHQWQTNLCHDKEFFVGIRWHNAVHVRERLVFGVNPDQDPVVPMYEDRETNVLPRVQRFPCTIFISSPFKLDSTWSAWIIIGTEAAKNLVNQHMFSSGFLCSPLSCIIAGIYCPTEQAPHPSGEQSRICCYWL